MSSRRGGAGRAGAAAGRGQRGRGGLRAVPRRVGGAQRVLGGDARRASPAPTRDARPPARPPTYPHHATAHTRPPQVAEAGRPPPSPPSGPPPSGFGSRAAPGGARGEARTGGGPGASPTSFPAPHCRGAEAVPPYHASRTAPSPTARVGRGGGARQAWDVRRGRDRAMYAPPPPRVSWVCPRACVGARGCCGA